MLSTLPALFFPSCMASWGGKESESDQEQEEEVIVWHCRLSMVVFAITANKST